MARPRIKLIPGDWADLERKFNRLFYVIINSAFILQKDADGYYEFIKEGNEAGDANNWSVRIEGNNLAFYVKVLGNWVRAGKDMERPQ